jgi:DNA-binding transcriptional LysR family regulator
LQERPPGASARHARKISSAWFTVRYRHVKLAPSIARSGFDTGTVRRVLEDWSFPPMPVHAVMTSRLVPARVRAFIDFLASRLEV